jgi:luciferase family oxidoreductase group 1
MNKLNCSVLDLAIIPDKGGILDAIKRSSDDAQLLDKLGYSRIWLAEHHNSDHFGCSATSILIGHIASITNRIRVGSGGILLPNHEPLIIAEQFGTLESIFPNRIDLGLGSSSGSDSIVQSKIKRMNFSSQEIQIENDIKMIQKYFDKTNRYSEIRAIPGEGSNIPLWVLGCSIKSARLAGRLGLPYVYGSHIKDDSRIDAYEDYIKNFRPSYQLDTPYFMICLNTIIAESHEESVYLSSSWLNMLTGFKANRSIPFSAPMEAPLYKDSEIIETSLQPIIQSALIGTPNELSQRLVGLTISHKFLKEIMVTNYIYDDIKRHKAYELIKETVDKVNI